MTDQIHGLDPGRVIAWVTLGYILLWACHTQAITGYICLLVCVCIYRERERGGGGGGGKKGRERGG